MEILECKTKSYKIHTVKCVKDTKPTFDLTEYAHLSPLLDSRNGGRFHYPGRLP